MENIKLKDLAGFHILSGIDRGVVNHEGMFWEEKWNYIQFCIDGITYRLLEDPEDGYRSYCQNPVIVNEECKIKLPDIKVTCSHRERDYYKADILVFIDIENGKEVLKVGTNNIDDYYPCCVFDWMPENLSVNMWGWE